MAKIEKSAWGSEKLVTLAQIPLLSPTLSHLWCEWLMMTMARTQERVALPARAAGLLFALA